MLVRGSQACFLACKLHGNSGYTTHITDTSSGVGPELGAEINPSLTGVLRMGKAGRCVERDSPAQLHTSPNDWLLPREEVAPGSVQRMELERNHFEDWAKINKQLFSEEWMVAIEEGSRNFASGGGVGKPGCT